MVCSLLASQLLGLLSRACSLLESYIGRILLVLLCEYVKYWVGPVLADAGFQRVSSFGESHFKGRLVWGGVLYIVGF